MLYFLPNQQPPLPPNHSIRLVIRTGRSSISFVRMAYVLMRGRSFGQISRSLRMDRYVHSMTCEPYE